MVLLGDVGQVKAYFSLFGDSESQRQLGAQFASNVPPAWNSFWVHPIVLLGDVCQVKACFYSFGDSVNLGARNVYGLHRMYHGHGNHFGHTRWYS
jgi:hypothetical protein